MFNRLRLKRARESRPIIAEEFKRIISSFYCSNLERLQGNFSSTLNIGCYGANIESIVQDIKTNTGLDLDIGDITNVDYDYNHLKQSLGNKVIADIENLPFKSNAFDLIISAWGLHSINKIEKTLHDIKNLLTTNGVFIASFVGGCTLMELRKSFMRAEEKIGINARVIPFIDVKDAGRLMQKAGFQMPVSESEIIEIKYHNIKKLFVDLRSISETNILTNTTPPVAKKTYDLMLYFYKKNFFNKEGNLYNVTLEMITVTGIKH